MTVGELIEQLKQYAVSDRIVVTYDVETDDGTFTCYHDATIVRRHKEAPTTIVLDGYTVFP